MSALATSIYKKVDGLRYYLEQQQSSGRDGQFPQTSENFTKIFQLIEDYLNTKVHQEIVTAAALQGDCLLNDHGKDHVDMVINRAGLILKNRIKDLKGFEIFILLLAIHFHDVGNIYGRDKHEENIFKVMEELGQLLPLGTPLKVYVTKIAMSHGGTLNGDKDTIASLPETDYLQGIEIRPALIASILRYADEISDDYTRAARFLYDAGIVPPQSKVFHDYSKCLQPAAVNGNTLVLKFDIPREQAIIESTKKDTNEKCGWCRIFLYDEILNRLKKCLCELEYCRKYSQGFINISLIQADITVSQPKILNPIYSNSIRLRLSGYPAILNKDIEGMCEEAPFAKNGTAMKELVEDHEKGLVL